MIPHIFLHSETILKFLRDHKNHENCYRAGFFSLIYPWYRDRFRRYQRDGWFTIALTLLSEYTHLEQVPL